MVDFLRSIMPLLILLSAQPAAGIAASVLLRDLRIRLPAPQAPPASRAARLIYQALYRPRWARWTATGLALFISLACTGLIAILNGGGWSGLEAALASFIAPVFASLVHGQTGLSNRAPWEQQPRRDLAGDILRRLLERPAAEVRSEQRISPYQSHPYRVTANIAEVRSLPDWRAPVVGTVERDRIVQSRAIAADLENREVNGVATWLLISETGPVLYLHSSDAVAVA
ncbi:MAG: hypothetical protein OHK0022_27840 [Roseiflexaceae bacterium]